MACRLTSVSLVLAVLAVLFSVLFAGWEVGSAVLALLAAIYAALFLVWVFRRIGETAADGGTAAAAGRAAVPAGVAEMAEEATAAAEHQGRLA